VLVAHGSMPAGYVLYVDKGRLIYQTSLIPWTEIIASPARLPRGKVTVKYQQTMTSRPFEGRGALFVNGRKVAERTFDRVLFSPGYDGFCVGADHGNRVSRAYEGSEPVQGRHRTRADRCRHRRHEAAGDHAVHEADADHGVS
jgi:hypothetical protein